MEGRVESVVPPCFVIRPSAGRPHVRHAGPGESRDAPGTDNGCPLRPRLRPLSQRVRMDPGPSVSVHTGRPHVTTRAQVRAVMPRALITVALSVVPTPTPLLKGCGMRCVSGLRYLTLGQGSDGGSKARGPFGLCVHTGSHLTRLSERRRRPTTPVLSHNEPQFRIRLIAVYRRSAARVKVSCVPEPVSVWSVGQLLRMVLHSTRHSREGGSP